MGAGRPDMPRAGTNSAVLCRPLRSLSEDFEDQLGTKVAGSAELNPVLGLVGHSTQDHPMMALDPRSSYGRLNDLKAVSLPKPESIFVGFAAEQDDWQSSSIRIGSRGIDKHRLKKTIGAKDSVLVWPALVITVHSEVGQRNLDRRIKIRRTLGVNEAPSTEANQSPLLVEVLEDRSDNLSAVVFREHAPEVGSNPSCDLQLVRAATASEAATEPLITVGQPSCG
jgi:hypothetical protein